MMYVGTMLVCITSWFLCFVTIPSTLAVHAGGSSSLLQKAAGDRTGMGLNGTGEVVKRKDRLGRSEAGEDDDDHLDFNFDEDRDANISREKMDMQGKPGRPGGGGLVPSLVGGGLIPTLVGSDGEHATTFSQPGIRLNCYYCSMMLGGWGIGGGGGRPPNHHWQWDPSSKIQQGNPFYGNPPWATTRRGDVSDTRHHLVHNYKRPIKLQSPVH